MRNRILFLSRSSIPYVKELMPLAKSIPGCIIMQQLDFWFEQKPDGFYKFMTPCQHPLYKTGDSWQEELGMSLEQFRTNFEKIGVRYASKKEFDASEDKFQGLFYCSYTDKRAGMTYWFRNHEKLDKALDDLIMSKNHPDSGQKQGQISSFPSYFPGQRDSHSTGQRESLSPRERETHSPVERESHSLGNRETHFPRDKQTLGHEMGKPAALEAGKVIPDITETTYRDFQNTQPQQLASEESGSESGRKQQKRGGRFCFEVSKDLVFPATASAVERTAVINKLSECEPKFHQQILDEIEGNVRRNSLRSGIVPLCSFLVDASKLGQFEPRAGLEVLGLREKEREIAQANLENQKRATQEMDLGNITEEMLNKLPPNIRQRVIEQQAARKS